MSKREREVMAIMAALFIFGAAGTYGMSEEYGTLGAAGIMLAIYAFIAALWAVIYLVLEWIDRGA